MEAKGWHMDRQQLPISLHFMITPAHENVAHQFIEDLRAAVRYAKNNPQAAKEGTAAVYGMVGQIPDKTKVHDYILQTLDQTMRLK